MSSVLSSPDARSSPASLPAPAPSAAVGAPTGRIIALDGLRGLAVAAVVAFHYWPDTVPGGYIGVSVFFTLSGFLIAGVVKAEQARTGTVSVKRFWLRRARRLLPAATIVLSVVLAWVAFAEPDDLRRVAGDVLAASFYVANWRTAAEPGGYEALFDTAVRPLGHFWSLSIEEQFYLFGPFLLALRARLLLPVLGAVTLAGVVWWWGSPDSYYATPVRVGEIAAGVALTLVLARVAPPRWVGSLLAPAALLGLGVIAFTWTETEPIIRHGGLLLVASICVVVMIGAIDGAWFAPGLSVAPLIWLGRRSYAIYLIHWPVLELSTWSPIVCLVVSFGLAEVSWRLVEEPMLAPGGWDRSLGLVVAAAIVMGIAAAVIVVTDAGAQPDTVELLSEVRPPEDSEPRTVVPTTTAADEPTAAPAEPDEVDVVTEPPSVLIIGDSQAVAVGDGFAAWATASGAYRTAVVGIPGCSGLIEEGWGVRFDHGESGEMWPGNYDGCAQPDLGELLVVHQPAAVLVAEWGTSTLDHLSPTTAEWRSTVDADAVAAWSDRYDEMLVLADEAGAALGFVVGPPCSRDAPCSEGGRIEGYESVLTETGRPVLDVGPSLSADPDRYPTSDGAHVEEGRGAFLLGAEVVAPFVASLLGG